MLYFLQALFLSLLACAETPNTQKITAVFKECGMGQFADAWVLFTGKDGSDHLFGVADPFSATDPLAKFCQWGADPKAPEHHRPKNPGQVGQLFTVEYETTNEVKKVLIVQEIK
jgi:hypothetical protein